MEIEVESPSQLPPSIADFTGREDEFQRMKLMLDPSAPGRPSAVVITTISGQGGVGKTALAIQTAHRLIDWFPDGQLYVNLRGIDATRANAADVLAEFLRALGLKEDSIPQTLERREQAFRTRMSNRSILVVLDNAASEEQIRPLLPGSPTCAVIVTSRSPLAALAATSWIHLDVLDSDNAVELLGRIAGAGRVKAEADKALEIVRRCGFLPLAVRISGARLQAKEHWSLEDLAERLRDEQRRLSELRSGDLEVRASFEIGYNDLSEEHARAFHLLGLIRMPEFSSWVMAALLDIVPARADQLLEDLCDAQLVQPAGRTRSGLLRYKLHDLLRDFAREQVLKAESMEERRGALTRTLGAYLALAERADTMLEPGLRNLGDGGASRWGADLPEFLDKVISDDPHGWFVTERGSMVLAVEQAFEAGLWEHTWELAGLFGAFFAVRVHWSEWGHTHELALRAARISQDLRGEAFIRRSLGRLYRYQGHWEDSQSSYEWCLEAFRNLGDQLWEAVTLRNLGDLMSDQLQVDDAEAYLNHALEIFRNLGDLQWEAATLRSLGEIWRQQRRFRDAVSAYERCLTIFESTGHRWWGATTMTNLGGVYGDIGEFQQANVLLARGLAVFRELDDRRWIGITLVSVGSIAVDQGSYASAIAHLSEARDIFARAGDRRWEARALHAMANGSRGAGDLKKGREYLATALSLLQGSNAQEADLIEQQLEAYPIDE